MAEILIVDDTPDTGEFMRRLLATEGHRAHCVQTGEEALVRLSHQPLPDLVILDQMMPGMDGLEVLRILREEPRTATLPVVIYSAIGDPHFREHAMAKGASDFWTKAGIDYAKLGERVAAVLEKG